MIYIGFFLLLTFALMFSQHEIKLWGSRKTPFAFVVYPFLALLFVTVFIGPSLGFYSLHPETLLVIVLFFGLWAVVSVALNRVQTASVIVAPRLEAVPENAPATIPEHRVASL